MKSMLYQALRSVVEDTNKLKTRKKKLGGGVLNSHAVTDAP